MPAGMEVLGKVAIKIEWQTSHQGRVRKDLKNFRKMEALRRKSEKKQSNKTGRVRLLQSEVISTNKVIGGQKKITRELQKQHSVTKKTKQMRGKRIGTMISGSFQRGGMTSTLLPMAMGAMGSLGAALLHPAVLVPAITAALATAGVWAVGGTRFKNRVQRVNDLIPQGVQVHSEHIERLSKKDVVFSPTGLRGTGTQAEAWDAKNAMMKSEVARMMTVLVGSQKGKGSNLGEVDLTAVLSDVGLKLKGFGFQGDALVNMTYFITKAATQIGSIYDHKTDEVTDAITKLLSGEGERFKLLTGMPLSKEMQFQMLNRDKKLQGIISKGFGYDVTSYKSIKREDRATAVLAARLFALSNKVLGKDSPVGGDFAATYDEPQNQKKLKESLVKDIQNQVGRIAIPVVKEVLNKQNDMISKEIINLKKISPDSDMGKAVGGLIRAQGEEEEFLYKNVAENITKLAKISTASEKVQAGAANIIVGAANITVGGSKNVSKAYKLPKSETTTGWTEIFTILKSHFGTEKKDSDSLEKLSKQKIDGRYK